MSDRETIGIDEAIHEVELVSRRLGLLHLAFARTAMKRLGEEEGRSFVLDAIREYGVMIGREVRKAVEAQGYSTAPENYGIDNARGLPEIGMHEGVETVTVEGEKRLRAYGCAMAKVWHEYHEDRLGRLYCFVDPAKYMAFNPEFTLTHTCALPDGDPHCEFRVRRTTDQERKSFDRGSEGWITADTPL